MGLWFLDFLLIFLTVKVGFLVYSCQKERVAHALEAAMTWA